MTAPLLAIVGPTASGKSAAAVEVASRLGAEIVSVDSMLLYWGMDVGTAKPSPADRARVPHHLIDVADPREEFSVSMYQSMARAAVAGIRDRGHAPLLVGGSGLHFRAVVDDLDFPGTDPEVRARLEGEADELGADALHDRLAALDPAAAAVIAPANVRRTVRALEVAAVTGRPFSSFSGDWTRFAHDAVRVAGVEVDRAALATRIERRVRGMVEAGFVDEVRDLLADGRLSSRTASQAIGYAEFSRHLAGACTLEEAVALTVKRTRALARRQYVWFRRDPRIRWFRADDGAEAVVDELIDHLAA